MASRVDLLLQVFEKFGAPVFSAVAGRGASPVDPKDEATKAAALVVKAGQAGAALAVLAGVKPEDPGADAARLAFGGVSAAALSQLYRETGRLPADAEIERLNAVFAAVLSFAEDYASAAQGAGRLAVLGADVVLDESQIDAMALHALAPMVGAVAAFSFGRPEKALAQEIAGRLTAGAAALVKKLSVATLPAPQVRLSELTLLRTLAGIFTDCYVAETGRLLALDEAARAALAGGAGGALPLDPVWEAFALRLGMLEILVEGLFSTGSAGAGGIVSSNPLQKSQDSDKSTVAEAPAAQAVSPPLSAPPPVPAEKPATPMGFFAGKKKKDEQGA